MSVAMWLPSTSASVMMTSLWYLNLERSSALGSSGVPIFTPSAVGTVEVSMTETIVSPDCNGNTITCTNTYNQIINIIQGGDASWTAPGPLCVGGGTYLLEATPAAGSVWTGVGVTQPGGAGTDWLFDPSVSGVGIFAVTHVAGDAPCQATEVHNIEVVEEVDATINDLTLCTSTTGQVNLTALFDAALTSPGGTFTCVTCPTGSVNGNTLTYNAAGAYTRLFCQCPPPLLKA